MITRLQARAKNEPLYDSNSTCKNGHKSKRHTSTGSCAECSSHPDQRTYSSSEPCGNGHTQIRYVSDNSCVACEDKISPPYTPAPRLRHMVKKTRICMTNEPDPARIKAGMNGEPTRCCRRGHELTCRTSNGQCLKCVSVKKKEREWLKKHFVDIDQ